MKNVAKNHHFVAQVEQRLNSIDPGISKGNQKIYSFEVVDREAYDINLKSHDGNKIAENLSFSDLFTFEILDEKKRLNLEDVFGSYESNVGRLTKSIIENIKVNNFDIEEEVMDIFVQKYINTLRNPYCIESTLSTIGRVVDFYPNDDYLRSLYDKIDRFEHPQWGEIATRFSVSVDQYRKWIKSLFMILVPDVGNESNIVESVVRGLFESAEVKVMVFINECSGIPFGHPLLSDRGYSILTNHAAHDTYEFNLSSTAFITYVFTGIKNFSSDCEQTEKMISGIISLNEKNKPEVKVSVIKDNPEYLSRYNKNVVYQSFNTVFCKSKTVFGVLSP